MWRVRWEFITSFRVEAIIRMYVPRAGANRLPWRRTKNGANKARALLLHNQPEVYGQTTSNNPQVGVPVRAHAESDTGTRMECRSRTRSYCQNSLLFLRTAVRHSTQSEGQSGNRF